jgi:hypothetical protein
MKPKCLYRSLPLDPALSQMNTVLTFLPYFFELPINIIFTYRFKYEEKKEVLAREICTL